MKSLLYLWRLKLKAQIRYYFRKLSSALLSLFLILIYGGIFALLFIRCDNVQMTLTQELSNVILITIGFLAMMLMTTLLSSKKALFYGEDAYFLFSGPFSRKQILSYLSFQTVTQSLMLEFFVLYLFSAFSLDITINWMFIVIMMVSIFIIIVSFLILTDYFYLLSVGDKRYKKIPYVLFGVFMILLFGIILLAVLKNGFNKYAFIEFINSSMFYIIPFFGWLKLILISYLQHKYFYTMLGFALLIIGAVISYMLLISYKGDFYEQALNDSIEMSRILKDARKGKTAVKAKVKKDVQGTFKDGAYAVMSKNILLMKKTKQWITQSDIIVLVIYIAMTLLTDLGFGFFVYMMIMYVFSSLQQSDLYTELNNYRIYLIPDKPLKKMISVILPTFLKTSIITLLCLSLVGIFYHIQIIDLIHYCLMLLGYICILISATVLSIRLLKSRSSALSENLFRMILMLICSIPSIVLTVVFFMNGSSNQWIVFMISYSSLIMNFIISFVILYLCRNMMNGRELKSE